MKGRNSAARFRDPALVLLLIHLHSISLYVAIVVAGTVPPFELALILNAFLSNRDGDGRRRNIQP